MVHFLASHPITDVAVLIFALALVKGGPAERIGASLMAGDWLLSLIVVAVSGPMVNRVHMVPVTPTLVLDFLLALSLLGLALRYGRLWIGTAMILQSLMLALHAMALSEDAPGFVLYVASLNVATCLLLSSLLVGAATAWRKRAVARSARSPAVTPSAMTA